MRSCSFLFVLLFTCGLLLNGCGGNEATSPDTEEIDRYLEEHPESAVPSGNEEPEGFGGDDAEEQYGL